MEVCSISFDIKRKTIQTAQEYKYSNSIVINSVNSF